MSTIGKWIAGILAAIISAVLVWQLTQPGGLLNPTPEAPHAPPVVNTTGQSIYDEKTMVLDLAAGERAPLKVMELWSAPVGMEPSCASGFFLLTWQVRQPYPDGGDELLIERLMPRSEGRTESVGHGATGAVTLGYCDEAFVVNNSLTPYLVELRHASGAHTP